MIDVFSSIDVTKILKIQRQRLRGWTEDIPSFFRPSIQESGGPGQKALYSKCDIFSFALFKELIEDASLDRKTAAIFVNSCRKSIPTENDWQNIKYLSIVTTKLSDTTDEKRITIIIFKKKHIFLDEDSEEYIKIKCSHSFKDSLTGKTDKLSWDKNYVINFEKIVVLVNNRITELYNESTKKNKR